jgi:hypothetical protein
MPMLELMHLEEGNAREKIAQWGVKTLCNMKGLENILVLPTNERNHWFFFMY